MVKLSFSCLEPGIKQSVKISSGCITYFDFGVIMKMVNLLLVVIGRSIEGEGLE